MEDDIEVSEAYFEWALYCLKLLEEKEHVSSRLIGCSLYTPQVNEITAPIPWMPPKWNVTKLIGDSPCFFFQLPCSWGAIYKASAWRTFLEYYELRNQVSVEPEIPGSKTNLWFNSWKRYLLNESALHHRLLE